jgi:hypothetical protein
MADDGAIDDEEAMETEAALADASEQVSPDKGQAQQMDKSKIKKRCALCKCVFSPLKFCCFEDCMQMAEGRMVIQVLEVYKYEMETP